MDILALICGLGFFLYGMHLMGDGMKKAAGSKMEAILERLCSTPLKGVVLGTVVTAVIQSSSATTIMVVGFVNSGIMKLTQAIGVIMGANIGTTVTGWVLCLTEINAGASAILNLFKPSTFAPVFVIVGTVFAVFSKKTKRQNLGLIFLGFGTLMVGMGNMSSACSGLANSPAFSDILTFFSHPLLGLLIGVVMTAVVQSSSAAVGILQALAITGMMPYATAIPIILGINIGASMPVLLSAIGANKNGKRTALIYLYFNLLGSAVFMALFYLINAFVRFPFLNTNADMIGLAIANTVIKLVATVVLFPFVKQLEKLVTVTVRGPKTEDGKNSASMLELIDDRFLATPQFALQQCHTVISHMADLDFYNVKTAIELQRDYDEKLGQTVEENENTADEYEDKLDAYLVEISRLNLIESESYHASMYLHVVGNLERISDHSLNLCELAGKIKDQNVTFSDAAKAELDTINDAVLEILGLAVTAFQKNDMKAAMQIEPLEQVVDVLCAELKDRHVKRLQKGLCTIDTGFIFNDLLNNYERISDHCSNIAIYVLRSDSKIVEPHKYLLGIEHKEYFETTYRDYHRKYCAQIGLEAN